MGAFVNMKILFGCRFVSKRLCEIDTLGCPSGFEPIMRIEILYSFPSFFLGGLCKASDYTSE
jgi:hypothetical protein